MKYRTARAILYRDERYLLAVHSRFRFARQRRWGLPGGGIEWRETPLETVARELHEELEVRITDFIEVGDFQYKKAMHKVYAAHMVDDPGEVDDTELLDLRWFSEDDLRGLRDRNALHAGYELTAVRLLKAKLTANQTVANNARY
ncbi:MAG: NUDIX hydrolase [Proteobacteria bacterium]|nr:NUDIX hydrolase [Pseudomonadota bacterium]